MLVPAEEKTFKGLASDFHDKSEDLLENKNKTLQKFSCFHNFANFNVNYFLVVNWMAVEG